MTYFGRFCLYTLRVEELVLKRHGSFMSEGLKISHVLELDPFLAIMTEGILRGRKNIHSLRLASLSKRSNLNNAIHGGFLTDDSCPRNLKKASKIVYVGGSNMNLTDVSRRSPD